VRHSYLRFTVRSLMVAVAILAMTAWIGLLGLRSSQSFKLSQHYRQQSALYAKLEQTYLQRVTELEAGVKETERQIAKVEGHVSASRVALSTAERNYSSNLQAIVALQKERLAIVRRYATPYLELRKYCDVLAAKHRHFAIRPWLRVEPDPPEPE
jgi:septal ring factor EnvC (AmiA/AmiB activator)